MTVQELLDQDMTKEAGRLDGIINAARSAGSAMRNPRAVASTIGGALKDAGRFAGKKQNWTGHNKGVATQMADTVAGFKGQVGESRGALEALQEALASAKSAPRYTHPGTNLSVEGLLKHLRQNISQGQSPGLLKSVRQALDKATEAGHARSRNLSGLRSGVSTAQEKLAEQLKMLSGAEVGLAGANKNLRGTRALHGAAGGTAAIGGGAGIAALNKPEPESFLDQFKR